MRGLGTAARVTENIGRFPQVLWRYWGLIIGLFATAIVIVVIRGRVFHLSYPYNTFLFDPSLRFSDFTMFQPRFEHFGHPEFFAQSGFPYADYPCVYPPFMWTVMLPLYRMPNTTPYAHFLVIALAASGLALALVRSLVARDMRAGVAWAFGFMALAAYYPLILIDKLNEEIAWIVVALGLLVLDHRRSLLPASFFVVAAAIKIFTFTNSPFIVTLLLGFFPTLGNTAYLYLVLIILGAFGLTLLLVQSLVQHGISPAVAWCFGFTVLATSYPLIALIDRLNVEGMVWIVLALGLLAFARCRFWLSASLFALATSMKIFPFALFALLLSLRKWRQLGYGIVVVATLTLVSLWLTGPTVSSAWKSTLYQHQLQYGQYVLKDRGAEFGFNHSLFILIRQMLAASSRTLDVIIRAFHIYVYAAPIAGLLLYLRLRRLPLLNQMIGLTTCAVLLPWWSGDYTLLHLYVPWALLVLWVIDNAASQKILGRELSLLWYMVPFAIIFTPQSYLIVNHQAWGGAVKTIALLVLLASSLRIPLPGNPLRPAANSVV